MSIHLIITEAEQQAIVNALAFYNDYWAAGVAYNHESMEQWRLAFRADNRWRDRHGPVDQLATKIATTK